MDRSSLRTERPRGTGLSEAKAHRRARIAGVAACAETVITRRGERTARRVPIDRLPGSGLAMHIGVRRAGDITADAGSP